MNSETKIKFFNSVTGQTINNLRFQTHYSYPLWIKNEAGRASNGIRNSIYTKIKFITDLKKVGKKLS